MVVKLPPYVKAVVILVGLFLVFYILSLARQVFVLFGLSMMLAMLLLPFNYRLERYRFPRTLAILLSLFLITVVMFLLGFFFYNQIIKFINDMGLIERRLLELIDKVSEFMQKNYGVNKAKNTVWLKEHITAAIRKSSSLFEEALSVMTSAIALLGLLPIFTFFMLYYRDFFKEFLLKLFHSDKHNRVVDVLEKIEIILQNYLVGVLIVTTIISTLNVIGLLVIGVKYAIFFGITAGILTIIPYIGVYLGSSLPVIYTYITEGSLLKAFLVTALMFVIQFTEGHFITPNIVGSKVSLNPFATIIALIVGGHLWGPIGMVLFIPFTAVLKVIFDAIEPLKPYGFLLGNPTKEKSKTIK